MLYCIYYRFVPPLGTTPLFRTLLPSAPVRSARIVAQVMGEWGGRSNNVHSFSDNTQTEHHKLLGRLQNPHLACQTYFNRIQTEHQTLLNSDMHMFFFSNFLLSAMDLDHGLHCSAWDAAELLALVILCRIARKVVLRLLL